MDKKLVEDYLSFVNILHAKFKFYDKDKFEDDFVEFVKTRIKKDTAIKSEKVNEEFFHVIRKNTTLSEDELINMAAKELEILNVG